MKKILLSAVCILFAIAIRAQNPIDEVSILQGVYGLEKKILISDYMKLSDAESGKFWQIYDEYENIRKQIGKKRIENIVAYAKDYATLTDEVAAKIVKSSLANNYDFIKLQQKTFKKLAKALSPLKAAQFVQAEMYFENLIRLEIAEEIPFIGEFDKKD